MQTDKKQVTNKVAMSRALGAAFLSHQVEQLEKSVGKESRGMTSTNWRDRDGQAARGGKRGMPHSHAQGGRKKERSDIGRAGKPHDQMDAIGRNFVEKDADTVVVDASVLVHALGQVKKWCKDGREEEIVIPLEALNTLDLLKKGSTPLAQRARAASRILEAQVGTNPRIRVQRDDAFVPWDDVLFSASNPSSKDLLLLPETGAGPPRPGNVPLGFSPPPEWLRRTICCGSWEVANATGRPNFNEPRAVVPSLFPKSTDHTVVERSSTPASSVEHSSVSQAEDHLDNRNTPSEPREPKKVVLAVLSHLVPAPSGATLSSSLDANTFHPGRYERADGSLVRVWAQRAGIEVFNVDPSNAASPSPLPSNHGHATAEKRRSHTHGGSDRRELRESTEAFPERERKPSLVEKPIAMTIVNDQPVKVLRVLARGEKLDP